MYGVKTSYLLKIKSCNRVANHSHVINVLYPYFLQYLGQTRPLTSKHPLISRETPIITAADFRHRVYATEMHIATVCINIITLIDVYYLTQRILSAFRDLFCKKI